MAQWLCRKKRGRIGDALAVVALVGALVSSGPARAVDPVVIADVAPRAFSVIWVSTVPVLDASVRVFADRGGDVELTSSLNTVLRSLQFPPALARGVVKVDVSGLDPGTVVYVQTVTTVDGDVVETPAPGELLEVRTALRVRARNDAGAPVLNDVLYHDLLELDGTTPADGSLLLVRVPSHSSYALSAFAGEGFESPTSVVDLGNLIDDETGESVQLHDGALIELMEVRGRYCPEVSQRMMLRYRRVPLSDEATSRMVEAWSPASCGRSNTVCDDRVDVRDAQRISNALNKAQGSCGFNPDLDVVADGTIDGEDVQHVLNRLGRTVPVGLQ